MKAWVVLIFFVFLLSSVHFSSSEVFREKTYSWSFNPDPLAMGNMEKRYFLTVKLTDGAYGASVERSGDSWRIDMLVPRANYTYYQELPGAYRYAFNISYLQYFMTEDNETRALAHALDYIAGEEGFDNLTRLNFILSFVQEAIGYEDDFQVTGFSDYYQFPLETLIRGTGDCEDKSLLLATLSHEIGYDVILFVMNITGAGTVGHVAVGVHFDEVNYSNPLASYLRDSYTYHGKVYYYMESTANQTFSAFHPQYYVGVSPEEGGYTISDLRFVEYRNSWYRGYSSHNVYVQPLHSEESFPWFAVLMLVALLVYVPVMILSFITERRRCPYCHMEIEASWNYCPSCGYWLKYSEKPPPPPEEQSIK